MMTRNHYLAAILAIAALPATATTIQTWNFTGLCTDCPGNGTGVLLVNQAQANGPLTFQFSYSSAWISYNMTNANAFIGGSAFSGTTFTIPTNARLDFRQIVPITSFGGTGNPLGAPGVYNDGTVYFQYVPTQGQWFTGSNAFLADYGTLPTWTQVPNNNSEVPEPTSVAIVGLGLAGLAYARHCKLQRS
jgi:hypothetical protein